MATIINRLVASRIFRNRRVSKGGFRNSEIGARRKTAFFCRYIFLKLFGQFEF